MKCKESYSGFELVSPCSFPMTITITPRTTSRCIYKHAFMHVCERLCIYLHWKTTMHTFIAGSSAYHTHTHTHTYIYIYIYVHTFTWTSCMSRILPTICNECSTLILIPSAAKRLMTCPITTLFSRYTYFTPSHCSNSFIFRKVGGWGVWRVKNEIYKKTNVYTKRNWASFLVLLATRLGGQVLLTTRCYQFA